MARDEVPENDCSEEKCYRSPRGYGRPEPGSPEWCESFEIGSGRAVAAVVRARGEYLELKANAEHDEQL